METRELTPLPEPEVQLPKGFISLRNGFKQNCFTLLRCDVGLPPFLGKFGLNSQPILRLARIAGFRSVRIVSKNTESSETQFGLQGGVGGDGTMRGSLSTATTLVPEAYSDLLYDDSVEGAYVPRGRMWGDLTITLNTNEIQQRIRDKGHAVNDKKAWAKHINNAIVGEILRKGVFNLLRSGDPRNDLDALLQGSICAALQHYLLDGLLAKGSLFIGAEDPKSFITQTIIDLLMYSYVFQANTRRGNGQSRFSLLGVHAPAIDRAAILFATSRLTALNPAVKPLANS